MTKKEVKKIILSKWGISSKKVELIKDGCSTQNWLATKNNGERYVFRNAGHYKGYVDFQCDLLEDLRKKNFPFLTPQPIKTLPNNFVEEFNGGFFYLYRYIPGKISQKINETDSFHIGEMLATYHQASSNFKFEGYKNLRSKDLLEENKIKKFVQDCHQIIKNKERKNSVDNNFLKSVDIFLDFYQKVLANSNLIFYKSLKKIPCHGDLETRNIIRQNKKIVGFIDLGGISVDPAICDLQSCIHLNSLTRGKINLNLARSIVNGYNSKIKISKKQLNFLPLLIYADILKILCWVMAEKAKDKSRLKDKEATERIRALTWIIKNYNLFSSAIDNPS